jgi:uncharacterized protein
MTTGVRTVRLIPSGVSVKKKLLTGPPTACAPPKADPQGAVRTVPLLIAVAVAVTGVAVVALVFGAKYAVLLGIGLLLGVALLHSRFGFTAGFQQLLSVGNGQGVRAQLLLLGTAATTVALVAGTGAGLFGSTPVVTRGTLGIGLVVGAAMFGVGMQLAGSCASGTLYAVGAANSGVALTLGAFIAGGTFYTWAFPVLDTLPHVPGVLLADHVGWFGSWAITVGLLAAGAAATWVVQLRRVPPPVAPEPSAHGVARVYRGTWPMLVGAVVLGVLAGLVLLVGGHVWGLSAALALWGAKLLQFVGLHPEAWAFWRQPDNAAALAAPVLTDQTSLTNFGIIVGAAGAAAAAGLWRWQRSLPWRLVAASLLGGFLMGLGSRLSGGCNIGALIGMISSGSIGGWIWGASALAGGWIGVRFRPLFHLTVPKPDDSIC